MSHAVDHQHPYHDALCRCRVCKPPLVGETAGAERASALAGLALMGAGLLASALVLAAR